MNIIQMSTSATFLLIAIIIVRAIAIDRLPKKIFVLMWSTALLRLLLPFAIPSQLSVFTFYSHITATPTYEDGLSVIPNTAASYIVSKPMIFPENVFALSRASIVWFIGAVVFAVVLIVLYKRGYREFATSLPIDNRFISDWIDRQRLKRKIQVRMSDKIKSPLTYGVFRPVILLPKKTNWEDERELECVLTHEFVHIKRFDALTKIVLAFVLCIHWFNPMIWVMYLLANRDIELSCDEKVLTLLGNGMKTCYMNTLVNLNVENVKHVALASSFSNYVFEERIQSIARYKRGSYFSILLGIMIAAILVIIFTTSAI